MSASFDSELSAGGALAASPRALPNAPPKNELLGSVDGSDASSLAVGSALNVEPRTKPPEPPPKGFAGFSSGTFGVPPKDVFVSIPKLELGVPNGFEAGFDPKMLPPAGGAAAANPPLEAKEANPPLDGIVIPAVGAVDPKTPAGLPSPAV
jgi:hypothetical protein